MKINRMDNAFKIYNKNQEVKKTENVKGKKEDKLSISQDAKDYQFALDKIKNVSEVRVEKVDSLQRQIQAGTYNVSGKQIAEKMIDTVNFHKKI